MNKSIQIKINLAKFKSHIFTTKTGVKCIVIPITENMLFEGKDGAMYADFTGWEIDPEKQKLEKGFKQTAIIKQRFTKETFEAMSDDGKKNTPIFGNVSEWAGIETSETGIESETVTEKDLEDNDLPF